MNSRLLKISKNKHNLIRVIFHINIILIVVIFVCGCISENKTESSKVVIFNLMDHPILNDSIKGIKQGLAELGYIENKNIEYIEFNANGEMDKLGLIANEIINVNADVIIPVSTPVTQTIINEVPSSMQIVFSTVTNPNDVNMDKNPPNLTGVSDSVNYEANLKLIKSLFPEKENIGIIYNQGERNSQFGMGLIKKYAKELNLKLNIVSVSNSMEVYNAADALKDQIDLYYIGSDNTVVSGIASLLKIAFENKIPVIASDSGSVEKGALAAISVDYFSLGKKVAELVDQVLKGAKAGEIENIIYIGDELLVNLNSASKINFKFPEEILNNAKIIGN